MSYVFHKAESRGLAEHGWLTSHHTFSFANYYDPKRMGFGVLRVINDDIVAPGEGFPVHPHKNMEIISIPLAGTLKHGDSMGHEQVIRAGEVQVMSAGRGISHSEYNGSECDEVKFLQIWILPQAADIEPRYAQYDFSHQVPEHGLLTMVGPPTAGFPLFINQNAVITMAYLSEGSLQYHKHFADNGVYFFVLDEAAEVAGQELGHRDGLGLTAADGISLTGLGTGPTRVLCLEVPLS